MNKPKTFEEIGLESKEKVDDEAQEVCVLCETIIPKGQRFCQECDDLAAKGADKLAEKIEMNFGCLSNYDLDSYSHIV